MIIESIEDMKALVGLSCNVGGIGGPLMGADVSSGWALGHLVQRPDRSPSANVAY
jgi:hypothetical protein